VTFCGNLLYSQIKVFFLIFVVVDHWSVRLLHPSFHFLCCMFGCTSSMICSVEWHCYLCDMLSVPRIIPTQFLLSTVQWSPATTIQTTSNAGL